jgi:hypothetical protein
MRIRTSALAVAAMALLGACKDTAVPDYNNPSQSDYEVIKSRAQLQTQVTGLIDGDRQLHDFEILVEETIGRDVYRLDGAEPRYITVPLGNPDIGNVNFMQTAIWNGPYTNIRSAKLLISATEKSTEAFPTPLSDEEKNGVYGVAQTIKALQYIRLIETRDTVGVPIVVSEGVTVDPIRCKPAVLDYIAAVLDSGDVALAAAGDAFAFELPSGFSSNGDFSDPAGFREFNRGLKAKVEIYRAFQNYRVDGSIDQAALDLAQQAIDASFYNPTGSLRAGVYHVYSTASGDYSNPNYNPSVIRINPRVVKEAQPGDLRVAEKVNLDTAGKFVKVRDAASPYQDKVNASPTSPLAILTNAELILLEAEILWGKGQYANALAQANIVRTSTEQFAGGGLPLATNVTPDAVLHEILYEKRYALLFESPSRHVDYRMFGLLDELGRERGKGAMTSDDPTSDDFQGFDPVGALKIPTNEELARGGDVSCHA